MSEPTFVDPELEAEFAVNGFVRLRLFDAEEARALGRSLLELVPQPLNPNTVSLYTTFLEQDDAIRIRLQQRAAEILAPVLAAHVAGARIRDAGVAAKPAGSGRLPIHQHTAIVDPPFARAINCWVPLMDTSPQMSGLRMIPGSHQLLPFVRMPHWPDYYESFRHRLEAEAIELSVEAGEAILLETTLLHGSGANRSDCHRLALTCLLVSSEARDAVIVGRDDDWLEIFSPGEDSGLSTYMQTQNVSDAWRPVRRLPNRNRQITEREFRHLVALGARATEAYDPLDAVRSSATSPSAPATALRTGLDRARRLLARLRGQAA